VGFTSAIAALSLAVPVGSFAQTSTAPLFSNATASSGTSFQRSLTWGSTWIDHNGDGDLDLFANRHWKRPRFYLWRAGRYAPSPLTFFSGSHRFFDRHSCAWGEANGDGRADFFCDSGAQMGMGTGPNQLWIQTASGLSNRAKAYGVRDRYARSRTVNWLDYDSDGDLDIFTASKLRRGFPNRLFRNDQGTFTRLHAGLAREMNGLGSTWSDWDNDGDPDLLVLRYHPAAALAYENRSGVFAGVAVAGVTDRYWSSASWGDFDGDGWTDLQLVNHNRSVILHNNGGVFIRAHERRLARGASSTWIDVDNDGDLDSYVVQAREAGVNRPDFFLINSSGTFTVRFDPSFRGARAGSGESASVGDYNHDGRLDLFVTNGATIFEESLLEGPWTLLRNPPRGETGQESLCAAPTGTPGALGAGSP
jgi:hypothetical protein